MHTEINADVGTLYVRVRDDLLVDRTVEKADTTLLVDLSVSGDVVGVERLTLRGLPVEVIHSALDGLVRSDDILTQLVDVLSQGLNSTSGLSTSAA